MHPLLAWYRAGQVVRFEGHGPRPPSRYSVWREALYLVFALVIAPALLGFLFLMLGLEVWYALLRAMGAV